MLPLRLKMRGVQTPVAALRFGEMPGVMPWRTPTVTGVPLFKLDILRRAGLPPLRFHVLRHNTDARGKRFAHAGAGDPRVRE